MERTDPRAEDRMTTLHTDHDDSDPWLTEAVLEFATIAGLFAVFFGLFFLLHALEGLSL
jgi:hypothetical protein